MILGKLCILVMQLAISICQTTTNKLNTAVTIVILIELFLYL